MFRLTLPWTLAILLATGCLAPSAPAAEPPVAGSVETVEALVAEALEKSPALAAARAEVAAARERVAPAATLPDPMLSLGYENDGASFSLGEEPMTRLSLMAEQQVPWPGKLRAAAKLAAADVAVVDSRLARIRLSVEAAVRRAAARLLEARELEAVTREQGTTW
jgi:cobalt-zinc-cadmium efflux system outer membrane protein